MEIYERIKYLRKDKLRLSQEAFGEKLGVSRDVINNIELNRLQRPEQKEPLYKLICKEFNISYLWLTEGVEPIENDFDNDALAKIDAIMTGENERVKNVFKEFANLSEKEWETFFEVVEFVKAHF